MIISIFLLIFKNKLRSFKNIKIIENLINNLKKNKKIDNKNTFINFGELIKLDSKILSSLSKIKSKYTNLIKRQNLFIEKITKEYKELKKNKKDQESFFKLIQSINIDHTVGYIKNYNLEIYHNKLIYSHYNKRSLFYLPIFNFNKNFKSIDDKNIKLDSSKISLNTDGKYSITTPTESLLIANLLAIIFGNDIVLDGTGNVGVNTIGFARVFKKVLSIELNKENMEALNSNVALYDLKNVRAILGDTFKYLDKLEYDVVYLDPPWGGRDFKIHSVLDLKLGDIYVKDMVKLLKIIGRKGIVFKLPKNYNPAKEYSEVDGSLMKVYKVRSYFCIFIKF